MEKLTLVDQSRLNDGLEAERAAYIYIVWVITMALSDEPLRELLSPGVEDGTIPLLARYYLCLL